MPGNAVNGMLMVEGLIVVGVNDVSARAQKMRAGEMAQLGPLGGLKLPGIDGVE